MTSTFPYLHRLPELCYTTLPSNPAQVIAIRRGVPGYYPIETALTAEELNGDADISAAQVSAMLAGSLFGWEVPGADPERYTVDGRFIVD